MSKGKRREPLPPKGVQSITEFTLFLILRMRFVPVIGKGMTARHWAVPPFHAFLRLFGHGLKSCPSCRYPGELRADVILFNAAISACEKGKECRVRQFVFQKDRSQNRRGAKDRNVWITLGVDSPFFSTIVLCKNQLFCWVFDGCLKRRIPGKNGNGRYP